MPLLLVALVVLAVVVFGAVKGIDHVKSWLAGPADYQGPGEGRVTFTISKGETVSEMGADLQKLDVVESEKAFVHAASGNPAATGIQPGSYQLKHKMAAADAVDVLVNPKNMVQDAVTIPEGKRTTDVVDLIVEHTHFSKASVEKVLTHPTGLGLPSYAHGSPEGYLFPATYDVQPGETPKSLIRQMVAKWREEADSIHLESAARAVNLDPDQVITVASILEFEAQRTQDYPKVARAIYNRLKAGMPLQSDATVSYANGTSNQIWTSAAQRGSDSAYNTYKHKGLPPGPIGNPGMATIKAALHPAKGPWLYWVVVNLRTGETDFATTYAQHQRQVAKLNAYCKTSSAC